MYLIVVKNSVEKTFWFCDRNSHISNTLPLQQLKGMRSFKLGT